MPVDIANFAIDPHTHVAFAGEVMLLRWNDSNSGRTVTVDLPDTGVEHPFRRFDVRDKAGKTAGKRFMAVFVEIGDGEEPVVQVTPRSRREQGSSKPYGKPASVLYRAGWMLDPRVMAAAGTALDRDIWVSQQPCLICGGVTDVTPMAPPEDKTGYYAVACCEDCGEAVSGMPNEAFYRKCVESLQDWASEAISKQLGYASLGFVPPEELVSWAKSKGIENTLPGNYFIRK